MIDEAGRLLDLPATDWLEFYMVLVRETGDPARTRAHAAVVHAERRRSASGWRAHHRPLHARGRTAGRYDRVSSSTGTGEAPHNYMLWELLTKKHSGRIRLCLLRPLSARSRLYSIHDRLMRQFRNYTYLAAVDPRGGQ